MRTNAFDVVSLFEKALAEYTGAPYAVCIDSCTDAIFLSCIYKDVKGKKITIPKRTYLSVPQSIMQAGAVLQFEDLEWTGAYQLKGTNIYDSAKRFTKDMYIPGTMMCLSFHLKKILNIGKGGAVLTDDKEAVEWLKRARYEGRTPGLDYRKDDITHMGWNMYMTPEQAARGLALLQVLPDANKDQIENPPYRDLTEFTLFKDCEVVHGV
jgi:dTDP-4-amino-4,6-dideoxygalactose transaminase